MSRLIVRLPDDRDYAGSLTLEKDDESIIAGPFPVCGRADDRMAIRHGNAGRNPLLPYGDTPLGLYRLVEMLESGSGTYLPAEAFGPHGVVALGPLSGDAVLADANGRFQLLIYGGTLGPEGSLRTTNGALRLADCDQEELVRVLRLADTVLCSCFVGAPSRRKVATKLVCMDGDPIRAVSVRSRQLAPVRSSIAGDAGEPLMPEEGRPRRRRFAPRVRFRVLLSPDGGGGGGGGFGGSGYGGGGSPGDGSPSGESGQPSDPAAGPYTPSSGVGPYSPDSGVSPYTPASGVGPYASATSAPYDVYQSVQTQDSSSEIGQSSLNQSVQTNVNGTSPNQGVFQTNQIDADAVAQTFAPDEKLSSNNTEAKEQTYSSEEAIGASTEEKNLPAGDSTDPKVVSPQIEKAVWANQDEKDNGVLAAANLTVNSGPSRAREVGEPNTVYEQLNPDGTVKSRTFYDDNGRSFTRQDFDHTEYDKTNQTELEEGHEHIREFNDQGHPITQEQIKEVPEGYSNQPTPSDAAAQGEAGGGAATEGAAVEGAAEGAAIEGAAADAAAGEAAAVVGETAAVLSEGELLELLALLLLL